MSSNNYDLNQGWNSLAAEMLYACMHKGAPENELSFYEKRIKANGGIALDQACGTGRHLFELLERGLDVHGADSSADAIKFAQMKANELKVQPKLYHQRMEDLDIPFKYGTIYITNGTFQVFYDRKKAIDTLKLFRNHLNPEGQILIEISMPDEIIKSNQINESENTIYWSPEKRRYTEGEISAKLWTESIDLFEQILIEKRKYDLHIDERIVRSELHTLKWTYFHKYEFIMLLEKAGFSDIFIYSDYTEEPANKDSKTLVYGARSSKY